MSPLVQSEEARAAGDPDTSGRIITSPSLAPVPAVGRVWESGILLVMLVLAVILSLRDARLDSVTADEPWHLVAAIVQRQSGTWLIAGENPPLSRVIHGEAAILAGATDSPHISYRRFFDSLQDYLFDQREHDPVRIIKAARAASVLWLVGAAVAIYLLLDRGTAGLLAAALLIGNTAFFPHGHLVTSDVPFAFSVLVTTIALRMFLRAPTLTAGTALALVLAFSLCIKASALILVALTIVSLVAAAWLRPADRKRFLLATVVVPAGAIVFVSSLGWPFLVGEPPGSIELLMTIYQFPSGIRRLVLAVERFDRSLARYLFGVLFHLGSAAGGRSTYFLGKVSQHSSPLYHMGTLIFKSPVVWIAAVGAGLVAALRRGGAPLGRLLFAWAGLLLLFSYPGPRIGVRHIFSVLVLLCAAAAAALAPWVERRGRAALVAALLLAISPFALGRSLGRVNVIAQLHTDPLLADSNLDWGQDLLRLRDALASRRIDAREIEIGYFGGDRPTFRIPGILDLARESGPPRRYLAVSRQLLLVGPETLISGDLGMLTAGLARPRGRFLFRVGDSIDVFDRNLGPVP